MIASAGKRIKARGDALISDGIRLPIAYRALQAAIKVDIGTVNTRNEVDGRTALPDFAYFEERNSIDIDRDQGKMTSRAYHCVG